MTKDTTPRKRDEYTVQQAATCFVVYLWLSIAGVAPYTKKSLPEVTCSAGALVLILGLFFDGALFKLPTAVPFWILLELGSNGERDFGVTDSMCGTSDLSLEKNFESVAQT